MPRQRKAVIEPTTDDMAADQAGQASASPAEDIPPQLYAVTVRMQVAAHAGDNQYYIQMAEKEIMSIFTGDAKWIRLPEHFGGKTETRFLPIWNVVEMTVDRLPIAAQTFIAESVR